MMILQFLKWKYHNCIVSRIISVPSVVFWFGDLNFRIEDYDIHVVKCAIDSNKLPLLWERDQVRHLQTFAPLSRDRLIFLEGFPPPVCLVIANHDQQRVL